MVETGAWELFFEVKVDALRQFCGCKYRLYKAIICDLRLLTAVRRRSGELRF